MNDLFYQLIRVSIGTQVCLSRIPTEREWDKLYDMAKIQSLIGVCFVGLNRLGANADEGFANIRMNEMQYFNWMGMAALIQKRNEVVNRQCAELQMKLSANGLRSCILKGQGVGSLYKLNNNEGLNLSLYRQSGDIDMLVDCDLKRAAKFAYSVTGKQSPWAYKDIRLELFDDTEVELHIKPGLMFNPFHNRRWQKWYEYNKNIIFLPIQNDSISIPSIDFNLVYILQHCYMHLFESGVGLRQLMDYYFVLCNNVVNEFMRQQFKRIISKLGMMRFTRGVMWIMKEVFWLPEDFLLCEPDAKEGRYLLNEIMQSGNFGKYDNRFNRSSATKIVQLKLFLKRSLHLVENYPQEALWMPWYFVWHSILKLWNRLL